MQECSDPKRDWFSYRRVCYVSMERDANEARYDSLHEEKPYHDGTFARWAKDRSRMHPYHYKAGVTIGVADDDLTPWDNFTEDVNASPVKPSVAKQAPGEHPETAEHADEERGDSGE